MGSPNGARLGGGHALAYEAAADVSDFALEAVVRSAVGTATGGTLERDFGSVTHVFARDRDIVDLRHTELRGNLSTLILYRLYMPDLAPLTDLKNPHIHGRRLRDISAFPPFRQLARQGRASGGVPCNRSC